MVALAGLSGMGRRTIIKKVMRDIMPSFTTFLHLDLGKGGSIDDFFLSLLRGRGRSTISRILVELKSFNEKSFEAKVQTITAELSKLIAENETLIIEDAGGLLDEDGRYPDFLLTAIEPIHDEVRPIAYLVQTRMPPSRVRQSYSRISFIRVPPLSLEEAQSLVGAKLKAARIRFDADDLRGLSRLMDGHPVNIDFAITEIRNWDSDIKLFLKKPTELAMWKLKRAADYISALKFNECDTKLIGILLLFRFLPTDLMLEVLNIDLDMAVDSIRRLQDWHVIEHHNGVYSISLPLLDALGRSGLFSLSKASERNAAKRVLDYIEQYRDDDDISIALVEPAIVASLRVGAGGATSQWRQLILPSHFLSIAREAYNEGDYPSADSFCDRALEGMQRMSRDAKVEALRLKGLCAVRRRIASRFDEVITELERIKSRHSVTTRYFLEGFRCRLSGDLFGAEEKYLKCYDKNERNFNVCRELSQVYLSLGRHLEAETYGRIAYAIAPTNAYVVDIMVGVLIGKASDPKELVLDKEFEFFMTELKKYGDGDGKSFYSRRQAEFMLLLGEDNKARQWADKAVEQTPRLLLPYFIRAKVQIQRHNFPAAERDLRVINELIRDPESEEGQQYVVEVFKIEVELRIGQREYRQAYNLLGRIAKRIPQYLENELKQHLVTALKFDSQFHDPELVNWAKSQ